VPDITSPLFEPTSGRFTRLRPADQDIIPRLKAACDPQRLTSVFQPIFRARSGELEGCEALIRMPPDSGFDTPYEAFQEAARVGLLVALENAAMLCHLKQARPHLGDHRLFLNVSAPLFSDTRFGASWLVERLQEADLFPGRVVLEIPEIVRIRDFATFSRHLEPFRSEGFLIAIDDFGAGYTNLRMITDLSPDFVKVDRVFVDGISSHARKRILVEGVTSLCHRVNCSVIAEGVELAEDLETCLSAGVDFLQGFLFAHPSPAEEAFATPDVVLPRHLVAPAAEDMRRLLVAESPIAAAEPVSAAAKRFLLKQRLQALPVVNGETAVGLLRREVVAAGLQADRPVRAVLEEEHEEEGFDWVPETASVEEAAEVVRRRPEARRFEPLVVVGPNRIYRGLLKVDDLLFELARLKVELSLQRNDLTGLPGRLVFEKTLSHWLERQVPFTAARLNVRRFKPYNDHYGFLRGDELLLKVAALLTESLASRPGSVVAHLGADDFAYLSSADGAEETGGAILQRFDTLAREVHDPADVTAGGYTVQGRRGNPAFVTLVGLTLGLVCWNGEPGVTVRAILDAAEELLTAGKHNEASSLTVNRRALGDRRRSSMTLRAYES